VQRARADGARGGASLQRHRCKLPSGATPRPLLQRSGPVASICTTHNAAVKRSSTIASPAAAQQLLDATHMPARPTAAH
jgi:hypothetical protein